MKKFFMGLSRFLITKPQLVIAMLCAVMMATTATSFAYWKSGIDGTNDDKTLNIQIGTGVAIDTALVFGGNTTSATPLIPASIPIEDNQSHSITFPITVKWIATNNPSGSTGSAFESSKGNLHISVADIVVVDIQTEERTSIKNMPALGGSFLINVEFGNSIREITGSDGTINAVSIDVVITMGEPTDKAQYELIAGNRVEVTLSFLVTPNEPTPSAS